MDTSSSTTARHVLFLNWRDTSNPEGGGSEVYIERIAAELVAAGHRVTLLCAAHSQGGPEETNPDGVRVLRPKSLDFGRHNCRKGPRRHAVSEVSRLKDTHKTSIPTKMVKTEV